MVKKAKKLSTQLGHGLAVTATYSMDKFANSPSATRALLETDHGEVEGKEGYEHCVSRQSR